jgi:curved DNA-binding protein CbpA
MKCHPDRGGSHEQMVLLNEAWEILSDPERRQRYDAVRRDTATPNVRAEAAADAQQAHQEAGKYPRRWADFEAWLDGVAKDFDRAEFKPVGGFGYASAFPKAGKSLSGWLFILIGVALGSLSFVFLAEFFKIAPEGSITYSRFKEGLGYHLVHPWLFRFLNVTSTLGGAWLGAAVHQMVGGAIKQSSNQASHHTPEQPDPRQNNTQHSKTGHSDESKIIVCGNCEQKLRVPIRSSKLLVKCKKCQHEFYH